MIEPNSPIPKSTDRPPFDQLDEAELDIADYLRDETEEPVEQPAPQPFAALVIGAVGVVYGDIGTSPIYAFREALTSVSQGGAVGQADVLGLLSLLIWTLILIVSVKYVSFLLRVDNRGEGGVLALYTKVRLAVGRRSVPILTLAIIGAALFFGDAIITPAISVLSAVEGAELVVPALKTLVVPVTMGILFALFMIQRQGTATIAGTFGPITVLWFLVLAGLGIWHTIAAPEVLRAFNPVWGLTFLLHNQMIAFAVLGAVFLAVTGAEALYADLGHFGRKPIITAWIVLVFPALVLNYLGQGALVLTHPETLRNPFFAMAPQAMLPFLVLLATAATVIAAQAVISGAFSMGRAAIQLGLLPRLAIRHTSANQSGQIYIGAINWILLFGVLWLVMSFKTSAALASAYGIAVTGTMLVTTTLACLYLIESKILSWPVAVLVTGPIFALEAVFLASNLTKVADGGYVPLAIALLVGVIMWAWWRGTQSVLTRALRQHVPLPGFVKSMAKTSAHIVPGTAFFLSPDPDVVPSALLHNLKHNRVLHEMNVILTIETLRTPTAEPEERASYEALNARFGRITLRFGFMETPNVSRAMTHARKAGLKFDVMRSSFFLGRRRPIVSGPFGVKRLLDRIYAMLSRLAADPSDFYHLPRDRVVELGERVSV
ncbi:potassium transporter Kup [Tabrizicola sp.]|uniref:potassium transporter Kup n=1 Tax=Tabrizicola sp. TaxID=2005166 RepID=UPI00286CFFDE|nr:potassium transporter Kup [Tabrizicola sp.]